MARMTPNHEPDCCCEPTCQPAPTRDTSQALNTNVDSAECDANRSQATTTQEVSTMAPMAELQTQPDKGKVAGESPARCLPDAGEAVGVLFALPLRKRAVSLTGLSVIVHDANDEWVLSCDPKKADALIAALNAYYGPQTLCVECGDIREKCHE